MIPAFLAQGCKVVDLSADFRFRDLSLYEQWYQEHTAPELNAEAVYGLPELHRDEVRRTRLVGNPGCYPTGVILGLAPLAQAGPAGARFGDCRLQIRDQRRRTPGPAGHIVLRSQ